MFDLFGTELPLAARFFIAFLAVLALIGVTAWLVRRFGGGKLGGAAARGRQPRLAVIDAATVDARRRLVLIRRDNIEHLLMIGGPTDLVVEPNIVRAVGSRDVAREPGRIDIPRAEPARPEPARIEPAARPAEGAWPLQPEPMPAPPPARAYRSPATEEPWHAPEPGARARPADSLTGLAAELSTRLNPPELPTPRHEPAPRVTPVPPMPAEPPAAAPADHNLAEMAQQLEAALRRAPANEAPAAPATAKIDTRKPRLEPKVEAKLEPKLEPKFESKFEPKFDSKFEPPLEPPPAPRFDANTKFDTAFDTKPEPKFEPPKFERKPEPKFDAKFEPKFDTSFEPKFEPKAEPRFEVEPAPQAGKKLYDNLEEEMASLLGRPSNKP